MTADTEARLTEAQRRCLTILAERDPDVMGGWCNYGIGCGVKRNVVAALEAKGLAQFDSEQLRGVSARVTDAGRAALARKEG